MAYPKVKLVVQRLGKPDVRVEGRVLSVITAKHDEVPEGDTWSDLTLLEQDDGAWIIVMQRSASNWTGPVGDAVYIPNPLAISRKLDDSGLGGIRPVPTESDAKDRMIAHLMEILRWSALAKRMANHMGWDVTDKL
ncbi:hypothetical protein ACFFNU_08150 [Sphingomonas yabuuchiae]